MSTTTEPRAANRKSKIPAPAGRSQPLSLAIEASGLAKGTLLSQLEHADWTIWSRYLVRRKQPAPLAQQTRSKGLGPLLWGFSSADYESDTQALLAQLQQRMQSEKPVGDELVAAAEAWLKELPSRRASAALAIEALAWSHALPKLAVDLPAHWWRLLTAQLLEICHDAAAIPGAQSPLAQQLLAGELPLTLAWILPEIAACAALAKQARVVLSDGILDLLDEGMPHGRQLAIAQPLLACWTRATLIGQALNKASLRNGAQDQLRSFVRHVVSLSRPGGSQMLAPLGESHDASLLETALQVAGDDASQASAEALRFGERQPPHGKGLALLPTAVHSEWSELASLRAHWSKNSPALAINFSGGQLASELVSQQRVIWSGRCDPEIFIDGAPAARIERWEEVCSFTDDDVHYLELEAELAGGWKTQRQFLLARTDAILLIADAIIGPARGHIDYCCHWPIASSLTFVPAEESCEGTLQAGSRRAANVVPLALPEWRSDGRRGGSLSATSQGLTYRMVREAQRLYVPLLFDLEPWRIKRELTWRQLAVGHNLVPQSQDVAVGYRVQLYKQQWLIYRSLAERASRTVLGQNIYSEFVCARFNRGGDAETLIEIE